MNRFQRIIITSLCFLLSSCATGDRYSFLEFAEDPVRFGGPKAPEQLLPSDQLALKYAKTVASILRSKSKGARMTHEASSSTQVLLAALVGAHQAFNLSSSTLAVLGFGSAITPKIEDIFNPSGRGEAYTDAVRLIEEAQGEYLFYNQSPSQHVLTQNGVILVQRVQSSIHVVEKTLTGRIPTLLEMKQATAPMSAQGAGVGGVSSGVSGQASGYITATGDVALPVMRPIRDFTAEQQAELEDAARRQREISKLRGEILLVREAALKRTTDDPNFYSKALRHIGIDVGDGITLNEYLKHIDKLTDRTKLVSLKEYFSSIPGVGGVGGVGGAGGGNSSIENTRDGVIAALSNVPISSKNDPGYFRDLLRRVDDATPTPKAEPFGEEEFKAHVNKMTDIGKLKQLLDILPKPAN